MGRRPSSRNGAIATPMDAPGRVFFRNVQTENISAVVARRIRSAIGLGLISDGERLPRESDLADQLGVSSSALREGLSILRTEGLIFTRPGKNGGSFVQAPAGSNLLIADELVHVSASDLRDLADWRQMLAATSAALAATRASPSTADRLLSFADQLVRADSLHEATRAMGRFHLELALGAQSMRLSMGQFMMHEEFDWLASTLLEREPIRRRLASEMQEIAGAVRDRDTGEAAELCSAMVSRLATELAYFRLELLAQEHRSHGVAAGDSFAGLATTIRDYFQDLLALLEDVAESFEEFLSAERTGPEIEQRLAELFFSRSEQIGRTVYGVGFLSEPRTLRAHEYFMAWWQRNSQGVLVPDTHHVMDTRSDEFYDYGDMEILASPREHGTSTAMGPYIDHGGVDDYLITTSHPVFAGSAFFGILAADTLVADLERFLAPWLVATPGPVVAINKEFRILVSNTPLYAVGDILQRRDGLELAEVGIFGWQVARLQDPPLD